MIEGQLLLIEKHNLGNMVAWLLEHNQSQSAPYHNLSHCMDVMYLAQHAYCYEQERPYEKAVCIAALFHDVNHSMGFYADDKYNTDIATECLHRYLNQSCSIRKHNDEENRQYSIAIQLIGALQWPHKPLPEGQENDYTIAVNCLRDADLFQYMTTTMASTIGIKNEFFKHWKWDYFLDRQLEFLEDIQYHSEWGKGQATLKRNETIRHLQQLKKLCYGHDH